MILKSKSFTHNSSDFCSGLNVPEKAIESSIEKIVFSTISNALAAEEMYDDRDSAPSELITITGDLQKTLSFVSDDATEYELVLLLFRHYHEITQLALKQYMLVNSKNNKDNEEDYMKAKVLEKMFRIKDFLDDEDDNSQRLSFSSVLKRISFVKKAKYNFDKYLVYINEMKNKNSNSFFEDGE